MSFFQTIEFIRHHPLTKTRPLVGFARYGLWQLRSRLAKELEYIWINETKLIVRRGMTGFTGNIYCGLYEFADMGFVMHSLRPDDVFVDGGANVGAYTILASGVCGARTIAFEPDPGNAAFLRRNVKINALEALVCVQEMALGDGNGEIDFTLGRDTTNRVATAGDFPTRRIPVARLDDIAGAQDAAIVKLDVEGFEACVLAGALRVLGGEKLLAVQSEALDHDVTDLLTRFGFRRAYYDPTSRILGDAPIGAPSSNGLFVRDWEAVRGRIAQAPRRAIVGHTI